MSENETLTEEELVQIEKMSHFERDKWRGDTGKLAATIKVIDEEFKSTKGLEKFLDPGVLINDRLILSASPDEYNYGILLRAFDSRATVEVTMTVKEVERATRLLRDAKKAATMIRRRNQLKALIEAKRRRRY